MRRKFKEALLSPAVWLTLLAGGVALLNVAENYKGRTGSTDVFTYLDYARNLWNGMGFVGRIHLSFDLWARGFDPIPMESNRLLHPLALLLGRLLSGDWLLGAAFVTCLLYMMTVPAVYWLGTLWFGRPAAVLGTLFFALHPDVVEYTLWGYSDPLFTLLLLASVGLALRASGPKALLPAGLLMALACLTRPSGPAFLLPFAVWAVWGRREGRGPGLVCCLLPALLLAQSVPLLNRLVWGLGPLYAVPHSVGGYRFFLDTALFPGATVYQQLVLPAAPVKFLLTDFAAFSAVAEKVFRFWTDDIPRTFLANVAGSASAGVFLLLGLFLPVRDERVRRLRLWFFLTAPFLLFMLSLTLYKGRYLYPLIPFAALLCAFGLLTLAGKIRFGGTLVRRGLAAAAAVFLLLPLPVGRSLVPEATGEFFISRNKVLSLVDERAGAFIDSVLPRAAAFLSDWFVFAAASYSGDFRPAGLLPRTLLMLENLTRGKMDCDALLLTGYSADPALSLGEWGELFSSPRPFLGFIPHAFSEGKFRAVLYARDGGAECARLLSLARSAQGTERVLPLLGRALQVRPRSAQALADLASARAAALREALPLRAKAEEMLAYGRPREAFALLESAGALAETALPDEAMEKIRAVPGIGWVRYTNNPSCDTVELTLSHFPCSRVFTDGLFDNPANCYEGGDMELVFALGKSRQVDRVELVCDLSPARNGLRSITVFSSVDNWTWSQVRALDIFPVQAGRYRLVVDALGVFAPYLKVRLAGDGLRPVPIGEIEVWGLSPDPAPVPERRAALDAVSKTLPAARQHRKTGRLCGTGLTAEPERDAAGFLAFGRNLDLRAGRYTAVFQLRVGKGRSGGEAVRIDLACDSGRKIVASRSLEADRIALADGFAPYTLDFVLDAPARVEPRVFYTGTCPLEYEGVRVTGRKRIELFTNTPDGAIVPLTGAE